MAGALAFFFILRGLWALVHRSVRLGGTSLRYWWPSLMLAWSWWTLWSSSSPSVTAWMQPFDQSLYIAYLGTNLPMAIVANGILSSFFDWPNWVKGALGSLTIWGMWFAAIVYWEYWWRRKTAQGTAAEQLSATMKDP